MFEMCYFYSCFTVNYIIYYNVSIRDWNDFGFKVKSVGKSALYMPERRHSTLPPVYV